MSAYWWASRELGSHRLEKLKNLLGVLSAQFYISAWSTT